MSDSAGEIANLLYQQAERVAVGDAAGAAAFFKAAKTRLPGHASLQDEQGTFELLREDLAHAAPFSQVLITNAIVDIDEAGGEASCRSYYATITDRLPAPAETPLQITSAGRYHDRFEKVDGAWRFVHRDYTLFDLKGRSFIERPALANAERGSPTSCAGRSRPESAVAIGNLLHRYAECIDLGDIEGAAALFANARTRVVGMDDLQDGAGTKTMLQGALKIFPCGTPRAKHMVTNSIMEIDEAAGQATCRSYYTVVRATEDIPLQVVAAGRYHDRFERFDDEWRFSYRCFVLDLKGHSHLQVEGLGHANRGVGLLDESPAGAEARSVTAITNLLYRYAELVDNGDLPGAAALFEHARVTLVSTDQPQGAEALAAMFRQNITIHPCGTPRTKHVISNPVVMIDKAAGTATCRSCYTVLQSTDDVPLQAVAAGRYHDRFEFVDGRWRFSYRDFSLFDLSGNIDTHPEI